MASETNSTAVRGEGPGGILRLYRFESVARRTIAENIRNSNLGSEVVALLNHNAPQIRLSCARDCHFKLINDDRT